MKQLFKMLARSLWRISAPVRRPVIRKFDHHMLKILNSASQGNEHTELQVLSTNFSQALSNVSLELARLQIPPANLELALSSIVRELARLQIQVEILQQQIVDLQSSGRDGARPETRLSVVGEIG